MSPRKRTTHARNAHTSHDVSAMARKPAEAATTATAPVEDTAAELSAKVHRQLDAIRPAFMSFADDFKALGHTRAQLAPKVMKVFGAWQAETGGSFVSFVRVLDPTVPADREGYRANNVYQAADYLRRLVATTERKPKDENAPKVSTPRDVIVDLLVTIRPVVESLDPVWDAFKTRYHWSDRAIAAIQKMVGEARTPLLTKSGSERKLHAVA